MGTFFNLLIWIDENFWVRESVNVGLVLASCLLGLAPLLGKGTAGLHPWWQRSWIFLALAGLALFACRSAIIFYPRNLNIDEATFIAQALTFEHHPIPWKDVDPMTSGPLNAYALLWVVPFGFQPSYTSGRVTEIMCKLGMLFLLYLAGRRIAGEALARVSVLPVLIFFCSAYSSDYINYTSEHVSIVLIGLAIYLLTRLRQKLASPCTTISLGLVLGLLPFAKLQSVVPSTALALITAWLIILRRPLRASLVQCVSFSLAIFLPGVLLLSVVACYGALGDFWRSYIVMAQGYGTHYATVADDLSNKLRFIYALVDPKFEMSMSSYLMITLSGITGFCVLGGWIKASRLACTWYFSSLFLVLATAGTIIYTNRNFVHYQFFLLPPLVFMVQASLRILKTWTRNLSSRRVQQTFPKAAILTFSSAYIFVPLLLSVLLPKPFGGNLRAYLNSPLDPMQMAILQARPPAGRLAIWGWAPQYSARTGTPLGTRDSTTEWALTPGPLQEYYRQRFLHDLEKNQPDLFLEAIGPSSFVFNDPKRYGIASFPELEAIIATHYRQYAEIGGLRLSVRNDLPLPR